MLFTAPGERVNRPDFGCGLLRLVFAPNSDELAAATQFLVQGSLQQWLGDLIEVNDVQVESDDARLLVEVQYTVRRTQQQQDGAIHSRRYVAMIYFCCDDDRRRNAVKAHPTLNGIDFLEVLDDHDDPFDRATTNVCSSTSSKRKQLKAGKALLTLLARLRLENVRIEGGERIKDILVTEVISVTLCRRRRPVLQSPIMY